MIFTHAPLTPASLAIKLTCSPNNSYPFESPPLLTTIPEAY